MEEFPVRVTEHGNGTCSLSVNIDFGLLTPDDLIALGMLAKRHGVTAMQPTPAKKISFVDVRLEEVSALWEDLQAVFGERLYMPQGKVIVCLGSRYCRLAVPGCDGYEAGARVAEISRRHHAGKVKVGICACPRGCTMPKVRDIGIFAAARGWTVVFGGGAGIRPSTGTVIATGLDEEALYTLVEKLYCYIETFKKGKERSACLLERMGEAHFRAWLEEH